MMIGWLIYRLEFPVDDGSLIGSSILQGCLLVFVFINDWCMSAVLKRIRCGLFSASISCFVQPALQSQRYLDTQEEITEAPKILSRVM